MVSQMATVRSFAGERAIKNRFETLQREWWDTREVEMGLDQRAGVRLNLVNAVAVTASVGVVSLEAFRGHMTVGDILLVLTLTQSLITAVQPITRTINTAGDVDTSAERLVELLANAPTVLDAPDARPLEHIDTIEFRNVSFAYPGTDHPSLEDVSFQIEAGKILALVGPSGSGKSTLIKLLMRFYDPTSGEIAINGVDIRTYTQASIRAAMGTVLQDVALFNDTIEDNIGFARPGASREAIREAAEAAHADAFIRGLPDEYMTLVGERGVRLSGGEKQRVAIARALLRDPQIIILDEATSALDSESERLVQEGLNRLMRGRTAIVIAHRLSTIAGADRILVLQHGRVLEIGDHGSLLKRPESLYAKLHTLQHGRQPIEA
jgi:ABC-type multidrug transport system fused ATPase/permease subunit